MCGVEMVREGLQVAKGWEGVRLDGDVEMAQAGPSRVPGQEKTMKEREGVKEGAGKAYDRKGKGRAIDEDEEKLRPVGELPCSCCALCAFGIGANNDMKAIDAPAVVRLHSRNPRLRLNLGDVPAVQGRVRPCASCPRRRRSSRRSSGRSGYMRVRRA